MLIIKMFFILDNPSNDSGSCSFQVRLTGSNEFLSCTVFASIWKN
mgnify:CR=1 FL=1